ncbi:MAG: DNA polymerase Y family protein [Pirellulales bacterium]|nr:DNA polymerase Y family protein [Pirellulales bacterium]
MRRALCIWLPDWTVQRFNLVRPELKDRPVVFFEIYRGSRRVAACSDRAKSLGVAPGMPVSEAAALAEAEAQSTPLCLEPYDPTADRQMLEKIALWCQQFSPVVGLEDAETPSSLLLDITGLGHLFGGESALADKIVRSFRRRSLSARIGVADTVGAAWAIAHFGDQGRQGEGETGGRGDGEISKFASPGLLVSPSPCLPFSPSFPIESLRLPDETVALLHQLGVYQVGQLALLPRNELNCRFGPDLLKRWDQALGRLAEPIPALPPPVDFCVEQAIEYPTARRDTIEWLLQQLIGQLAQMLVRSGRGATRLSCRLDCNGAQGVDFSVGMFQPTASPQHLFELLEMRLERLALPAPVAAVSLRAAITAPLERRQQELFLDSREAQRPRWLAALIDRLSSRLGRRAVVRPRLISDAQPELAYHCDPLLEDLPGKRVRRRFSLLIPAELPPRPLRLARRPVSLAAISIQPDGPPLQFHFHGREHRIAKTWGPERIQTGWWRGRAIGRDYYRIETTTGRRFWLFRRLRDGQWFLHGVFE